MRVEVRVEDRIREGRGIHLPTFQTASIPSSGYSSTSTFLIESRARMAACRSAKSSKVKSSKVKSSKVKSSKVKPSTVKSSKVKSRQVTSRQAESNESRPGWRWMAA